MRIGIVSPEEASQWYTIVHGSLEQPPAQWDVAWDMISNTHTCEACWADPKLPRRWRTCPGKLATVLGRKTWKWAAELPSAHWPPMRDLHATMWSSIAIGED